MEKHLRWTMALQNKMMMTLPGSKRSPSGNIYCTRLYVDGPPYEFTEVPEILAPADVPKSLSMGDIRSLIPLLVHNRDWIYSFELILHMYTLFEYWHVHAGRLASHFSFF